MRGLIKSADYKPITELYLISYNGPPAKRLITKPAYLDIIPHINDRMGIQSKNLTTGQTTSVTV